MYKFHCYRYAPESFVAWKMDRDGSYKVIPGTDHNGKLGYILLTRGKKAVLDEIKRMERKENKKQSGITYGFYFEDSKRDYAYIREMYTFDTSLESRLRLYKKIKGIMGGQDWRHVDSATATLGDNLEIVNVVENAMAIDRRRPCSIRVVR